MNLSGRCRLKPVTVITKIEQVPRSALLIAVALALATAPANPQIALQPSAPRAGGPAPLALLGAWGTADQCASRGAGRDPARLPYVISEQWIQRGFLYCLVTWGARDPDSEGLRVRAFLQCGEDAVREYRALFELNDDRLGIQWSPDFRTRLLDRCE